MEKLKNTFDDFCEKKYEELKNKSITYGDLRSHIHSFKTEIAWSRENKQDNKIINAVADKLFELFDQEVNKKTID